MGIDLAALAGFSPADTACLREHKPSMAASQQAVIDAFYARILSFSDFKAMIEAACERDNIALPQLVAHINDIQFKHWQQFFRGYTRPSLHQPCPPDRRRTRTVPVDQRSLRRKLGDHSGAIHRPRARSSRG